MKRILGEYSQIIGYTFTGLIFGISFFLLFINFYHFKEISTVVLKDENTSNTYTSIINNINQVRNNISSFDVNNYRGTENSMELLSIKSKLLLCTEEFESLEIKSFFDKSELGINDIYKFQTTYQTKIANNCIAKQIYDITIDDNTKFNSLKLKQVAPFMRMDAESLINRTGYLKGNLENNSSYFFSSIDAKNNIFEETRDSYYEVSNAYLDASTYLLEISKWFQGVAGGTL